MKRKILLFLLTALLAATAALSLFGCGGQTKNAEFEEFETVAEVVLENSVGRMGKTEKSETAVQTASTAEPAGDPAAAFSARTKKRAAATPFTQTEKDGFLGIIEKYADNAREESDNYVKGYFDLVAKTVFSLPLIAGDALRTYPKVGDFYGISVGCREEGMYIMAEKNGTEYSVRVYSDGGNFAESRYAMVIDFKSESDFSFYIYESAGYEMFYYGDSDLTFFNLFRDAENDGGFLLYYLDGGDYSLESADAADECYAIVKDGFAVTDGGETEKLKTDTDYIITAAQWAECYNKYMTDNGHFGAQDGQFDIRNGVLYGWTGKDEDCPAAVTLPSTASSLYYELRFPRHVEEIVIPAAVKHVVVEKGVLDKLEGDKESGGDNALVECPLQYFCIRLNAQDGSDRFLKTISVQDGSRLFFARDNCLYSADGMLLYLADTSSVTSFTLGNFPVSDQARSCITECSFASLKSLTAAGTGAEIASELINGGKISSSLDELAVSTDGENGFTVSRDSKLKRVGRLDLNLTAQASVQANIDCAVDNLNITAQGDVSLNLGRAVKNVSADIIGGLLLSSETTVQSITLSDGVTSFGCGAACDVTVTLPHSLYSLKTLDREFSFDELTDIIFNMDISDCDRTELQFETTVNGETFRRTCNFPPMSETDRQNFFMISNFDDVTYHEKDQSEFGYAYVRVGYYRGSLTALTVPQTLNGYFVHLTLSPQSGYEENASKLKELTLPAGLRYFRLWLQSPLDRISYGGTKAQFTDMAGGEDGVYGILETAKLIACADGDFHAQPDKLSALYESGGGDALKIDIDKYYDDEFISSALQITLTTGGKTYKTHYFGDVYTAHSFSFDVSGDGSNYLQISFDVERYSNLDRVVIKNVAAGGAKEIIFEPVGEQEFSGVIAHEYGAGAVVPPTCTYQGYTIYRCLYCYHYYEGDFVDKLAHNLVTTTVEGTCLVPQHMRNDCINPDCEFYEEYDFTEIYGSHGKDGLIDGKEPTCTQEGYYKWGCGRCGETWVEVLPKKEHDYDLTSGICSICGAVKPSEE